MQLISIFVQLMELITSLEKLIFDQLGHVHQNIRRALSSKVKGGNHICRGGIYFQFCNISVFHLHGVSFSSLAEQTQT